MFLALALGFAIGPRKLWGFTLGSVTATLLAGVLIGQLGITVDGPDQVHLLPDVPVRGRLRRRTAVLPRDRQGRPAPDRLLAGRAGVVPCSCPSCARSSRAWTSGYAAGLYAGSQTISAAIGVATDQIERLGLTRRSGEGAVRRCHSDRLRRDLHLRHDRLGRPARAARPEADRRRPAGRLRRVRTATGRRSVGLRARRLLGVSGDRDARLHDRRGVRSDGPAGPRALSRSAHLRRARAPRRSADRRRRRHRPRAGRHRGASPDRIRCWSNASSQLVPEVTTRRC